MPRHLLKKVHGYVWCDVHCNIHEEGTDPYQDGTRCTRQDQRSVFVKASRGETF